MTVAQVLVTKGFDVVTAAPETTLHEVITLLTSKRIGAVVIVGQGGALLGILSERDIVRALGGKGPSVLAEPASAHMTADLVTATPDMRIVEAMEAMTAGRFRHLPVVQNGTLKGLVSIGDVVKFRLDEVERERQSIIDYIGTT